jgi:hypothetical protein
LRFDLEDVQAEKKAEAKADAVLTTLVNATPADIDTWVENNVTDVQGVKDILKKILRLIGVLAKPVLDRD